MQHLRATSRTLLGATLFFTPPPCEELRSSTWSELGVTPEVLSAKVTVSVRSFTAVCDSRAILMMKTFPMSSHYDSPGDPKDLGAWNSDVLGWRVDAIHLPRMPAVVVI